MLEQICRKLDTYAQSVKDLAKRFCDLYRRNPTVKFSREPKTVKGFQALLGYGNYTSFKKQVYAIMIVSMSGNLAEIVDDDPDAHILRLLPQTIVLDPPEESEFNSFLQELRSEFERRTATLILTPIGGALGAIGGASVDEEQPPRGALIGGGIGSLVGFVVGTIIDVSRHEAVAQQIQEGWNNLCKGWNDLWGLNAQQAPDPVGDVEHSPGDPLAPTYPLDTGGVGKFVGPNGIIDRL